MGRLRFQSKYYFWTEVCAPAFTFGLSRTMSLPPSIILSCSLLSSLSNPPSAIIIIIIFFSIRSSHMGPLIKTNRAHQEGAPEDQSGQSLLIYRRPDQTYHILSGRLRDNVRLLFAKSEFSSLRKKKRDASGGPKSAVSP